MSIRASAWPALVGSCLAVAGCGVDPVNRSIERLASGDVEQRRAAARELGKRADSEPRVITALAEALADSDAGVQFLAIRGLGEAGSSAKSHVPELENSLSDPDSRLRVAAALAIQKIDPASRSYVPVLTAAMRAGDGRVMLEVGRMGTDAAWAVPTLVGLLSHETPQLRALAARTLGRIGPAAGDAVGALRRATNDPNAAVQSAAQDALVRIRNGLKPLQREGP